MSDDDFFRRFIEDAVGGRVVRLDRTAIGSSRVTFLVDVEGEDGRSRELVLRHDSGDGPLSGTEIDLAHEAVVYRALADQPVRIPRLVAEAPDGLTLLVERALGSESLAGLSEADRLAVERDLGCALAELHAIAPARLPLGDMRRPADAAEHARIELSRWGGFQRDHVDAPSPISRFAHGWLSEHVPARVERTVLCHGDAGVGNFLHDGRSVTALLDWEFAHLGDPLDDVAWVLVRGHLMGQGDMRAALAAWSERSGLALEAERITYYRAMVLLRMAISCEIALGRAARGSQMDTTTYEALLPVLGFFLPQALREAGCRDVVLDPLEAEATKRIEAHPILRDLVQPLVPWEAPA